jgi:uncharacterized protein (DUF2126 family)
MAAPDLAPDFDADVRAHDAALAARGLTIWVGAEPTFTDRLSQAPEWMTTALGGEKRQRAGQLLRALVEHSAPCMVLRSVGRLYPGEEAPRWNLGLYRRRDAVSIWQGPPDPLQGPATAGPAPTLQAWADAQAQALVAQGWQVDSSDEPDAQRCRIEAHRDGGAGDGRRTHVHFVLHDPQREGWACIELPPFPDVAAFMACLALIEAAARSCALPALVFAGAPPPVDASVEWTTVTPDPAVIEINSAPSVDATEFVRRSRVIYAAAAAQGLAPFRLYYNGAVADSGGGGQISLGGPSPEQSVFVARPRTLPRLVRYFIRHPSLSYLFAHDHVGPNGQSARADERGTAALDELALALHLLERQADPSPELLWRSIAPFLCDATGNSHRAEINVEKLWNATQPGRGTQGLVEFRALRMQHNVERAGAVACLLRAVVAMICLAADDGPPLREWGRELHERFALPYYLGQDLEAVLAELAERGLGLGPALRAVLRRDRFRSWADLELPGATLEVRRALDFSPLLGDAGSPEQLGTSRLVDASTTRLELRLRPRPDAATDGSAWQVRVAGVALPMRAERDADGDLRVFGLRYRSFVPLRGLHPALPAQVPVRLRLTHPAFDDAHVVALHEWRTDGAAYPGLPVDLDDAQRRRAERAELTRAPRVPGDAAERVPPAGALGAYQLDLRFTG